MVGVGSYNKLKEISDDYLKNGEFKTTYEAYRKAFSDFLKEKQNKSKASKDKNVKTAGFMDFDEFAGSAVGAAMLQTKFVSFSPVDEDDEDSEDLNEIIAASENSSAGLEEALEKLLTSHAENFTPLTAYFFQQAVILQRPLSGENGVLNDAEFLRLVAADNSYAELAADKLADKLIQKTATLIKKHSHPESPTDWMDDL